MARQPGPKHWRSGAFSGPITPLLATCARIERVQQTLANLLPDDVASICRVCTADDVNLTVAVPSPAWAARLRYQERMLLKLLRTAPGLEGLTTITLRVDPVLFERKPVPDKRRRLPASAARLLEALAEDAQPRQPDEVDHSAAARPPGHAHGIRMRRTGTAGRPDDTLAAGLRRLARRAAAGPGTGEAHD